jgi:phage/plasmid primase-like uncharacterized protein
MSARTLAERFGLRKRGTGWAGTCPACGYADAFTLNETRDGKPLWWCASCRDKEALTASLRGEGLSAPADRAEAPERPSDADRTRWAIDMWESARDDDGTIRRYMDSRGLRGFMPDDVRLLPSLRHRESGTAWPCMIAALRDVNNTIRAVHRTWLRPDGTGKAPIEPAKKSLGRIDGGAVRLYPATDALILAEGIETALAASLLLGPPAWASLSAGGLEAVRLPAAIRHVVIAADNDVNGVGQRAAETLARRLVADGRRVRIATPDEPGSDFNDVLLARETPHD